MKGLIAALLLAQAASPAHAQWRAAAAKPAAGASFVPGFLGTMDLSLKNRPFFGSMLLNSLQSDVAAVTPMSRTEEVKEFLQARIEGPGRVPMAVVAKGLGKGPIEPETASAILLANALARPDQFQEVVTGIEGLKPGLGERVGEILGKIGVSIRPRPDALTYDARGRIERIFDGD